MKDRSRYPALARIEDAYSGIRLFRDWHFGPAASMRREQSIQLSGEFLNEESSDNLVIFLERILTTVRPQLSEALRNLYEGVDSVRNQRIGGAIQLFLREAGDRSIRATRLSDWTLRFLFLLAVLMDPKPPLFIAIEEPELGLHPDLIPRVADLLKDASTRTQLVITTHSRMLVDAMADRPESILVCEKEDGESSFTRLDSDQLKDWLEKYSLGDLWSRGMLGGNRLVKVRIHIEGGGDSALQHTKFRKAWADFFRKAGLKKMPGTLVCGGRKQTFDSFETAVRQDQQTLNLLLVDSEDLVGQGKSVWQHLKERKDDNLDKPSGPSNNDAFLMICCMETWFLADRAGMAAFFRQQFNDKQIKDWPNLEDVPKTTVIATLKSATKACGPRQYAKGEISFNLLVSIDPHKVAARCDEANRLLNRRREALS